MQNIPKMMEAWGTWVANNNDIIGLLSENINVIPERIKSRIVCSSHDHDANIINELMVKLLKKSKNDYELLLDYYVFGKTFVQLAQSQQCSDTYIGKRLKKAEGIIEGMLIMSDIKVCSL